MLMHYGCIYTQAIGQQLDYLWRWIYQNSQMNKQNKSQLQLCCKTILICYHTWLTTTIVASVNGGGTVLKNYSLNRFVTVPCQCKWFSLQPSGREDILGEWELINYWVIYPAQCSFAYIQQVGYFPSLRATRKNKAHNSLSMYFYFTVHYIAILQ